MSGTASHRGAFQQTHPSTGVFPRDFWRGFPFKFRKFPQPLNLMCTNCNLFTLSPPIPLKLYTFSYTGLTHNFEFLAFGRFGAQDWAPKRPNVKNWKWWVTPVWRWTFRTAAIWNSWRWIGLIHIQYFAFVRLFFASWGTGTMVTITVVVLMHWRGLLFFF